MGPFERVLLCVAAPAECERVLAAFGARGPTRPGSRSPLEEGVDLLVTGVGPTLAGVSTARSLAAEPASAALSLGIGGALPGGGADELEVVLSTRSVLAGEGRTDASGHTGLAAMGFGPFEGEDAAPVSPELVDRLGTLADHRGPVATVSVTSGTDPLAAALAERTGAMVEAMEGAAVHLACRQAGVPFAEIRVISNIAGDRDRHPWRLGEALDRLGPLALETARALRT